MTERKTSIPISIELHFPILLLVFLVVHAYLFWRYGIRTLYDSESYIAVADYLLDKGKLPEVHQNFYLVHIGLIAIFRFIFPGEILPYLLFQCVISALAVVALCRSAEKLFNNSDAGLAAALVYLLWIDNIHWNTVAMTESLMQSVTCFLLYVLVNFRSTAKDFLLIILLLFLLVFIRPTGILIVVASCIFLMTRYNHLTQGKPMLRIGILIGFVVLSYIGARQMFTHWDFMSQLRKGNIVTYVDLIEDGSLDTGSLRMDTTGLTIANDGDHPMDKLLFFAFNNPSHFTVAAFRKIFYLLAGVRPYYSVYHNVFIVLWLLVIYSMSFLGWRANANLPVGMFVLAVILANCVLIGIGTVDWDNRFYIPMAPGIVLLAGGGVADILKRCKLQCSR